MKCNDRLNHMTSPRLLTFLFSLSLSLSLFLRDINIKMSIDFVCHQCHNIAFNNHLDYLYHLKQEHNNRICCCFCKKDLRNPKSFRNHLFWFHGDVYRSYFLNLTHSTRPTVPMRTSHQISNTTREDEHEDHGLISQSNETGNQNVIDFEMGPVMESQDDPSEQSNEQPSTCHTKFVHESVLRLLQVKESLLMSDKQFTTIMNEVFKLYHEIDVDDDRSLKLLEIGGILKSRYKIDKFVSKSLHFQEPNRQIISGEPVRFNSIEKIVLRYLESDDFWYRIKWINDGNGVNTNSLKTFRDTESFQRDMNNFIRRRNGKESSERIIYVLIDLFIDDFNVLEPLSSAASRGKLLAVYMSFSDIELKNKCKRSDQELITFIK